MSGSNPAFTGHWNQPSEFPLMAGIGPTMNFRNRPETVTHQLFTYDRSRLDCRLPPFACLTLKLFTATVDNEKSGASRLVNPSLREARMDPNDLLSHQRQENKEIVRRELFYSSAEKTEDGWYNAEAGVGVQLNDGKTKGLNPNISDKPSRDAGLLKGPNVSAQAGVGDGKVGAFANAELFRLSAANSWAQGDIAFSLRTGAQFGAHNELKIAGTGLEIGKNGIGLSILGVGFKIKSW